MRLAHLHGVERNVQAGRHARRRNRLDPIGGLLEINDFGGMMMGGKKVGGLSPGLTAHHSRFTGRQDDGVRIELQDVGFRVNILPITPVLGLLVGRLGPGEKSEGECQAESKSKAKDWVHETRKCYVLGGGLDAWRVGPDLGILRVLP